MIAITTALLMAVAISVLYAHLEESSISVLLLMSRECVQLKHPDVLERLHQLQKAP
jgi:hypothetical protein